MGKAAVLNTTSCIGTDHAGEIIRSIRSLVGHTYSDFDRIESIVYDTIKDYESLPPVDLSLLVPHLPVIDRKILCEQMAQFAAAYGSQCAASMLVPLVSARVKVLMLEEALALKGDGRGGLA